MSGIPITTQTIPLMLPGAPAKRSTAKRKSIQKKVTV